MKKTDSTPIWVFLAYSSIEKRKTALILIWSNLIFSLYCIPWVSYFSGNEWIEKLFLIDDWSWAGVMLPMTLWYWLSLRWIDKNAAWE